MAKRLAMAIDTKGCINCHSCAVACKVENNLPDNIWRNRALVDGGKNRDTATGTYPELSKKFYTVACQHCEEPACAKVCPVGATFKDEETGIVMQDYDKCIGCRMCMAACHLPIRCAETGQTTRCLITKLRVRICDERAVREAIDLQGVIYAPRM